MKAVIHTVVIIEHVQHRMTGIMIVCYIGYEINEDMVKYDAGGG